MTPSTVLAGEMWVMKWVRPMLLPVRYAPVSNDQTARMSSRIQPRSAPSADNGALAGTSGAALPSRMMNDSSET